MIRQLLREALLERYFNPTIPDDVKKLSAVGYGRNIIWYGNKDQMIMLKPDEVEGMWGNIYYPEKMDELVDLIQNYPERIELECSYGAGDVVNLTNIHEEQSSYQNGSFQTDYDGQETPATTGDEELDRYVGVDDLEDLIDVWNSELLEFFTKNRMSVAYGYKTPEQLMQEFKAIAEDESDVDAMKEFLEYEIDLKNAQDNQDGDFNKFKVQLRDGHHRVMAAIKAGEPRVFINLLKDDIEQFKGYYRKV